MFSVNGDTGDIICRQGDSGEVTFTGIPTSKPYKAYFSIYNSKRKILVELENTPFEGVSTFVLNPEDMDKLEVPTGEKTATYYYGLKICLPSEHYEDTLVIGNKEINALNKIIVYPKITEGTL